MSIYYTTRKAEANRVANAIYNVMGTPASVMRESGIVWRVQHNSLSNEALDNILKVVNLQ